MRKPERPKAGQIFRCAIYTRKSSDDGLEQDFNSLDAQREACEAYVTSQRHAGWIALFGMYDDGGLSGGTMERPALQRLLADIKAGKVQIIVVYKVDRLTRSLADFAKIVEVLDAQVRVQGEPDLDPIVLSIEAKLRRAGMGKRFIIANGADAEVNQGLVALIKEAFSIRNQLLSGSDDSIEVVTIRSYGIHLKFGEATIRSLTTRDNLRRNR